MARLCRRFTRPARHDLQGHDQCRNQTRVHRLHSDRLDSSKPYSCSSPGIAWALATPEPSERVLRRQADNTGKTTILLRPKGTRIQCHGGATTRTIPSSTICSSCSNRTCASTNRGLLGRVQLRRMKTYSLSVDRQKDLRAAWASPRPTTTSTCPRPRRICRSPGCRPPA